MPRKTRREQERDIPGRRRASMRPRPMPRKTGEGLAVTILAAARFNEAAAHAAENPPLEQQQQQVSDLASMRPRPMPRKTAVRAWPASAPARPLQ